MWIQAVGETCNVHSYSTRFRLRFNGRMFCRSIYVFPGRNTTALRNSVFYCDVINNKPVYLSYLFT